MEDRQLFRRSDLRISDVASELATNSTYISACLNGQLGVSFPVFVARYRVEYAQQLIRNYPDIKIAAVWTEAGFSHESTFFRIFKSVVGMTPKEWIATLPR